VGETMAKKFKPQKSGFKPGEISVFGLPNSTTSNSSVVLQEMERLNLIREPFVIPTEIGISERALRILGVDPQKEQERVDDVLSKVVGVSSRDVHKYLEATEKASSEKGPVIVIDSVSEKESDA